MAGLTERSRDGPLSVSQLGPGVKAAVTAPTADGSHSRFIVSNKIIDLSGHFSRR
jgi:hypothetical protein